MYKYVHTYVYVSVFKKHFVHQKENQTNDMQKNNVNKNNNDKNVFYIFS